MPPKAKPTQDQPISNLDELLETVKAMTAKIDGLSSQLTTSNSTITSLSTRLSTIEALLKDTQAENSKLKEDMVSSAHENTRLLAKLNKLEQYTRSWSVRVLSMSIPSEEETDPEKVMQHLYNRLLRPILEGAVTKGLLSSVPQVEDILESAHVLPGKLETKPIIARFYTRNIRSLIFRLKKEFAPKEQAPGEPSKRGSPTQRQKYPIYDDLTKLNFQKLRSLAADKRVLACWSVKGQLKFKCHGEDLVRRVPCALTPTEELFR